MFEVLISFYGTFYYNVNKINMLCTVCTLIYLLLFTFHDQILELLNNTPNTLQ
jgi:hypothetical protein